MRFLLAFLILTSSVVAGEYPTVNLPLGLRQQNWLGNQGEGSCVHASMTMLFRWQGRYALAEYWRSHYENGEYPARLAARLTREKVRFAQTQNYDVKFLEWACKTRRGCAVNVMQGRHMVCLVHFDDKYAGVLDNNSPGKIIWYSREGFLKVWCGWAVTPVVGSPAPPLPTPEVK